MASELKEYKFGDLLSEPVRNGIYKKKEFHGRGARIVNMGELFAHSRLRDIDMKRVQLSKSEIPKVLLREGDLLFARRSLTAEGAGKCSIVKEVCEPTTFESSIIRARPNAKITDSDFLYYLFSSPHGKYLLGTILRHVAVAGITGSDLKELSLQVPPLAEQKAIAHILGTLDDKIELNRKMNETLEAIASALFRSWFVDFEFPLQPSPPAPLPKGEGMKMCGYKSSGGKMVDSELGPIPEGWQTIPLYDTARYINGAAFKNSDFCTFGEGLPVIKIAELKAGIGDQTKWSQRQASPDQLIDKGDLIYSWSGSPDTSLDAFLWSDGRGLLNQHIFKVVAPTTAQKRFVYYLLKHLRPVLVGTAKNKQTTGLGHVTVADMKRLRVCFPSKNVLAAFDHIAGPIFDKAFANTLENRSLTTLRDTLLPKLLSGELSLPAGLCLAQAGISKAGSGVSPPDSLFCDLCAFSRRIDS